MIRARTRARNTSSHAMILPRLLVPVDGDCDQGEGDDPENDVFGAILLFGVGHT